jgi:hypothetical protein
MKEYENLTEAVKGLSLRERASYEDITEAALHLLPENERLPLLRKVLAELPTPVTEDPVSESTGLPQTLRGAIHALTRVHPPNLVVDAAMLEMPEEQRAEVAKAFQPVSYEHVRTEREYDFREDEAVKPRKLALYRKVTAG